MTPQTKNLSIKELITLSRTYRRFDENKRLTLSTLRALIDLARLSPSGGNLQPLKYMSVVKRSLTEAVFPHLAWAGYLKDWGGPVAGERPAAYIVIVCDTKIHPDGGCDHGIAAQSIMLGAAEQGLGGCIIGSIDRPKLRKTLQIPKQYEILLVLALGTPVEVVTLKTARQGDIKYWRDAQGRHYVPKRPLAEIILPVPK